MVQTNIAGMHDGESCVIKRILAFAIVATCLAGGTGRGLLAADALPSLADIANTQPFGNGHARIQENWQALCAAYTPEELGKALKPLAQRLLDPPLPISREIPLRPMRDSEEAWKVRRFSQMGIDVPNLLVSFWQGDCVTKDRSLLEAYTENVRYKLGPTLYRVVQAQQPSETYVLYWNDWADKKAGVEAMSEIKTIDELNSYVGSLEIKAALDQFQPVPLGELLSEDELAGSLYRTLKYRVGNTDVFNLARQELLAAFTKGGPAFLDIAEAVRKGEIRVEAPESVEFDWVKLALDTSTIRFDDVDHHRNAWANKRFVELAFDPAVTQSRRKVGYDIDEEAETTLALDLIHEMAQKGFHYAYAQAYCVIRDQLNVRDKDAWALKQFELLEALKQDDQPYDERAHDRLSDRLGFLDVVGAKFRAWQGEIEVAREELGSKSVNMERCYNRMGMTPAG